MRIVADENIDRSIITALREGGHEVLAVAEHSPGASDATVAEVVAHSSALFLTEDKEFADALFWKDQCRHGVVLVRLGDVPSAVKGRLVAQAVSGHASELANAITSITPRSVRIRRVRSASF